MNSLEFIDKEIEQTKIDLCIWKVGLESKKYLKDKLQTLQQIKSELEAWYIVKKHLNRGEYVGLKNFFRFDLDKYNTLEKALEVNNNE